MGNPGDRHDPLTAFCFSLEIEGLISDQQPAFFKSVSGLKSEAEVVPYREGGLNGFTYQLVGPTKWPNLVLKRGFISTNPPGEAGSPYALLKWRESWALEGGKLKRKKGKVIQLNSDMSRVCSWSFFDGWPCKWEGPDYDASKTELAIETIEIAHSGLFFKPGG